MPREEPVGRPLAEAPLSDDQSLHLLIRKRSEPLEIEVAARDSDHVLRLAAREAERDELVLARLRHPFARRERVCVLAAHAEPLHHPVPNRERREERDLLRRNRADERLVRIRRERRAETFE